MDSWPYRYVVQDWVSEMQQTGSARHLETWNTPGYLFGIFQDLENLEK